MKKLYKKNELVILFFLICVLICGVLNTQISVAKQQYTIMQYEKEIEKLKEKSRDLDEKLVEAMSLDRIRIQAKVFNMKEPQSVSQLESYKYLGQ